MARFERQALRGLDNGPGPVRIGFKIHVDLPIVAR